ncbi:MAG: hypothetical protein QM756_13825 [Polyangiaceae bacterium]
MRRQLLWACALISATLGCSSPRPAVVPHSEPLDSKQPAGAASDCDPARDQAAILEMAGSFRVEFNFEETVALTPGYQLRPPSKSGATELVLVLVNAPGRVSLQHVLVMGSGADAGVVKHWRQDWTFEDASLLEFAGKRRWRRVALSLEQRRCTWSQAVFEVDDSPRYEGYGRWVHGPGGADWLSNATWRPLPRREYTKRSDYDVLLGLNRHRLTDKGWEHEQDNVKLVLEPRHELARERGLNRYERVDSSATSAGERYWQAAAPFWASVRHEWESVFATHPNLELRTEVEGKRLYERLFERAEQPAEASSAAALPQFVRDTIASYVVTSGE